MKYKHFALLCILMGLSFLVGACQTLEKPTSTIDEVHQHMHPTFKEGFDNLQTRDHYMYHSNIVVQANRYRGFNKHQYIVPFKDPFLKAYGINTENEITYRIAMFDQIPYFVYKQDDIYYKADRLNDESLSMMEYDHPIFSLLKQADKDDVTELYNTYSFSVSYQDMITNHASVLAYIDQHMKNEMDKHDDADLSSVVFNIYVEMSPSNPMLFHSISIQFLEYISLTYPLTGVMTDSYTHGRVTFDFSYDSYTKDMSTSTTYLNDDHKNHVSDDLTFITIGETMTADLQYMVDLDYFKLTIQEKGTYHFDFTGINNVIFTLRHSENIMQSIRVNPGNISLNQGTYYFSIMNFNDTTGQVNFSFTKL